jgi:hypothetical protein
LSIVPGNGGPRWLCPDQTTSDGDAMPLAEDEAVRRVLSGITTGAATYRCVAQGRTAEAMSAQSGTTLTIARRLSDRMVISDGTGASLTYRTEPESWHVLSLRGRPTKLLRLLALAVPSLPIAWQDGLWWSGAIPAGHLRAGPAGWLRRLRVTSHFAPWRDAGLTVSTHLRGFHPSLPLSASAEIEAASGILRVTAAFTDGSLRFERTAAPS